MSLLKKYFGQKVEDREVSYVEARALIDELARKNAMATRLKIKHCSTLDQENPTYEFVRSQLNSFLAPYQYQHNPKLKGDTSVRYKVKDHETHEFHTFSFTQIFDNLFKQGIKGYSGTLEIKLAKMIGEKSE